MGDLFVVMASRMCSESIKQRLKLVKVVQDCAQVLPECSCIFLATIAALVSGFKIPC